MDMVRPHTHHTSQSVTQMMAGIVREFLGVFQTRREMSTILRVPDATKPSGLRD
jgi:aspartate aminotransferase-like enzyme